MKALKDSLDKAINHLANKDGALTERYLETIDKMVESLRPSVIRAVAPIGKSCTEMQIGESLRIDQAMADSIRSIAEDEVTPEKSWIIRITELDLENSSAKVRLEDEDEEARLKAVITDPSVGVLNNPYVSAFSSQSPIRVRGKATLKEGAIQTLYISDTE